MNVHISIFPANNHFSPLSYSLTDTDSLSVQRKYLRQYKGDMLSSSDSEQSEGEEVPAPSVVPEVRVKGRKYSSQMKEYEYDSKVTF